LICLLILNDYYLEKLLLSYKDKQ